MQIYGPEQGPRPLPWVKCQIFLKRFLYVVILIQIKQKFSYIVKLSLFLTVIFIISNFCDK